MAVLASAAVLVLAGAVQWQAPAGCPAAAAVEGRVHELLGRVPAEHELRAAGVVSGGPPWRLELETSIGGRSQRRALQAADCRAVAEAAAVILAVSVDPIGVSRAPVGEGIVEPPAARVAEPPPTSPSVRRDSGGRESRRFGAVSLRRNGDHATRKRLRESLSSLLRLFWN